MKITSITAWQVDLPLKDGRYAWSNGNFVEVFDATVVAIATDAGVTGYAESTPLGSAYLPSYPRGVRAGIAEVGPKLIGLDPTDLTAINRAMDAALRGHPSVKAPLDIACWDILGKVAGLPAVKLLGGIAQPEIRLYRAISQDTPDAMASGVARFRGEGYRRFQLKVGGDANEDVARIRACRAALAPDDILVADANTGWTMHEAARVVAAVAGIDVYIEQPCPTWRECLSIRRRTNHPFVLDEAITDPEILMRSIAEDAMDVVNLKISKVGGLTRARLMRDICVDAGIPMIIEDTWGGDIATAAIAHLAQSTPTEFCFAATDFNSYGSRSIAEHAPQRCEGVMRAPRRPGLGVEPRIATFGAPAVTVP